MEGLDFDLVDELSSDDEVIVVGISDDDESWAAVSDGATESASEFDETDDGAPRFVKRLANGKAQYLYRSSSGGCWGVANIERDIAENLGPIFSLRAADLPSEAELGWKYYDEGFENDPDLICVEVCDFQHRSGAPPPNPHQTHLPPSPRSTSLLFA